MWYAFLEIERATRISMPGRFQLLLAGPAHPPEADRKMLLNWVNLYGNLRV
jgi:hypothetical protein